jgi:hypothetical protein
MGLKIILMDELTDLLTGIPLRSNAHGCLLQSIRKNRMAHNQLDVEGGRRV